MNGQRHSKYSRKEMLTTVQNLIADTIVILNPMGIPYGTGKFSFFSIENKNLVASSDSATNKWDIAFRGDHPDQCWRSGPGNGGGFCTGRYIRRTDQHFRPTHLRTDAARCTPSQRLRQRMGITGGPNNLITPLPGKDLVIRTATGKYAKIKSRLL